MYFGVEGVSMELVVALKANHNNLHYLDRFQGLWKDSKLFLEMKMLNGGVPVEFHGFMHELVDKEVFLEGKRRVQVHR